VGTSTTLLPGIFAGGGFTIQNIAAGANASYVVLGWTGGAGTTWDTALTTSGAMLGESAIFTTATGNPNATPPGVAVNLKTTFGGITLAPIPEPATVALAGLGLAALMVFRRRS
jgi:hypothetical protein